MQPLLSSLVVAGALLLLLCSHASLASAARQDPKPHWPRQFSASFNETTKIFLFSWRTDGDYFYDADQQAQLVYRVNGRGDRYCGSIHPATDTPCAHLVVSGMRYLLFPGLGECCACCSAAEGCGILDPGWLDGAEFIGRVMTQGVAANEWAIRGLQPNQYYATADADEVPLQLDQDPIDYITFHPATYKAGPIAPSVFELPTGVPCNRRCPLLSTCTIAAVGGRLWQRVLGDLRRPAAATSRPDRDWRHQQQKQQLVAAT